MNNKLSRDIWFNIFLWGGLTLGVITYALLVIYNDFIFCPSVDCFDNALDFFSVPIKIITGGMVLAGFRATLFRSEQTRIQINETFTQNKFRNYIDHKKEFMVELDLLEAAHNICVVNRSYLYKNIFPENSPVCIKFDSREINRDRSWLDFRVDEYNDLVDKYNEIGEVQGLEFSERKLARWLSSYLFLIYRLDIKIPNSQVVAESYKGLFSDSDKINLIPPDIYDSFYILSEYFKHLSAYSLPSRTEKININNVIKFNAKFDEKLKVFTCDSVSSVVVETESLKPLKN